MPCTLQPSPSLGTGGGRAGRERGAACCLSRQEAASPRSPPARLRVGEAKQTPRDLPAGSQSHLLTGSWWERGRRTAREGNVAPGGSKGSFRVTAMDGAGIGSAAHEGLGVSAPQKGIGTPSGGTQHEEHHPEGSREKRTPSRALSRRARGAAAPLPAVALAPTCGRGAARGRFQFLTPRHAR